MSVKGRLAPGENQKFDRKIIRLILASPSPTAAAIVRELRPKRSGPPDVKYVQNVRRIVRLVLNEQDKTALGRNQG